MNAKIKRMSRRRAKKAVIKIYLNQIHGYLSESLKGFIGKEINSLTINELKSELVDRFRLFQSVEEDINDPNSILLTLHPQLESIRFYQPPVRFEVVE